MSEDKDLLEKEKQGREASDENMKEDEIRKSLFSVSETGEQDRTDDHASSEYTYLYRMYDRKVLIP